MTDRVERAFLYVAYVVAVAFPLAILLVYDGGHRLRYFDFRATTSSPCSATTAPWISCRTCTR